MAPDYVRERLDMVQTITGDEIWHLAEIYTNPDKMIWLVVGDARTQMDRLERIGFGEPVLVNETFAEGD